MRPDWEGFLNVSCTYNKKNSSLHFLNFNRYNIPVKYLNAKIGKTPPKSETIGPHVRVLLWGSGLKYTRPTMTKYQNVNYSLPPEGRILTIVSVRGLRVASVVWSTLHSVVATFRSERFPLRYYIRPRIAAQDHAVHASLAIQWFVFASSHNKYKR